MTTLLVLAKVPTPGRVKTRLCPPCSPTQAAALAEAALADTLAVVGAVECRRRVLVLDGSPGPWLPPGFEVIPQRGQTLDERLACAFADAGLDAEGAVLVGMDTPQLDGPLLDRALEQLQRPDVDAVLGPTFDGGYWAIGLTTPDPSVFVGVPMSTMQTYASQLTRLDQLGLRTSILPVLRDVDEYVDAVAVAELAPTSRFARALCAQHPVSVS